MLDFLHDKHFLNNELIDWFYFGLAIITTLILTSLISKLFIKNIKKTASSTENEFDDMIVKIIDSPLKIALKALGLYISFHFVHLPDIIEENIKHLFNSILIFALFWLLFSGVELFNFTFNQVKDKYNTKLSNEVINFISKGIKIFLFLLGAMTILQQWGINVSGFVASLGLGGLAFALAAKDTAANLFGSLVIFIDKPFQVGDWIKTSEVEGTILDIGIRSTKVKTFAQAEVTVPNANLANSAIINWSRMGKRRIKTTLGLTYDTTPKQVTAILHDLKSYLIAHDGIDDETIFIQFSGFGESSLDIFCYFFTKTTVWGEFMAIQEEVFLEFMKIITQKHHTQFAFPSQSLYVEKGALS